MSRSASGFRRNLISRRCFGVMWENPHIAGAFHRAPMAMRISATSHKARVLAAELAWGSRGVQSYAPHRKLAARSAARANREVIGPREKDGARHPRDICGHRLVVLKAA